MSGESLIAVFYYGAGLLYWPIHQLIYRRWSRKSRALLVVFLVNLAVVLGLGGFFAVMWSCHYFNHNQLPLLLLFPVLNLASIFVSGIITIGGQNGG